MAAPTVTYTFTNGTVASGPNVSTNFSDIIAALTDGTKSFSIDALTCAGSTILNGSVALGNATGDDITVTGYVASHVIPKTTNTYALGGSSNKFSNIYAESISGLPSASASSAGLVDTAAQTFAGVKTFNDSLKPAATKGIDYSANTGLAGVSSQVLKWYEEGTWTPVVTSSGGTITTVGTVVATYTRIGRAVTCTVNAIITAVGSASAACLITLPYAAAYQVGVCGNESALTGWALTGGINASSSSLYLYKYDGSTLFAAGNGLKAMICFSYII